MPSGAINISPLEYGRNLACSNHLHQENTLQLPSSCFLAINLRLFTVQNGKTGHGDICKLKCEFNHQKWWFSCQVMTQNDYGTSDKTTLLDIDLPHQKHPLIGHVLVYLLVFSKSWLSFFFYKNCCCKPKTLSHFIWLVLNPVKSSGCVYIQDSILLSLFKVYSMRLAGALHLQGPATCLTHCLPLGV